MTQYSYKVLEPKEDWKDTIIEKGGISARFTVHDFEKNIERMEKIIKELEGTHKLNLAMMDNIERNYPFVKEMSEQDLNTCAMYYEAKQIVKQYAPRIAEFYEALNTEAKEKDYVIELFGLNKEDGK
jgi:hypothetical protein